MIDIEIDEGSANWELETVRNCPFFLYAERFVRWVKETYYFRKKDEDIPQAKEPAPCPERAVCDFYGIDEERTQKEWYM